SIIQGIFTQVLSTNETMMSATESFTQDKQTEKLSAIMQEYAKHPAATKVFLMELKYLSLEIEEHLKKAS
ncbi:MAG: hypothetical protein KAR79_05470, partial [Simkaniaceae bacterium]|nr:hypothetical protein [Simkaniaceae bacterium]